MPLEPVLGQIMPFGGQRVPRNWALCDGSLLAIRNFQALFALLGTYYGGDGVNTFALPDLRGRAILGATGGSGAYPIGSRGGTVSVTLNVQQLPPHNHAMQAATTAGAGRGSVPAGHIFGTTNYPPSDPPKVFVTAGTGEMPLASGTNIINEGSNQPHNNMQPYLAINYVIALQGIYPSQN